MKRNIPIAAGIAAGLAAIAGLVLAEVAPADVVMGEYGDVADSLTGVPGDPANGIVVMTTRGQGNCIACHQVTELMETAPFHGEVGPSLDGVGTRWDAAQLRGIVVNAKSTFPDSVMPAFYRVDGFIRPGDAFTGKAPEGDLPPLLTAQQIEDVVAYLLTLTE
jgi:sulfur-oxidizing protein SoxX